MDVNQQQILVFHSPQKDSYQVKQVFGVKDAIAPVTFPDVVIELAKLFP